MRGVAVCVLVLGAGCGESMDFENAGSTHALVEDQQACDGERQTLAGANYVKKAEGPRSLAGLCGA